jgi:hypothetical protein
VLGRRGAPRSAPSATRSRAGPPRTSPHRCSDGPTEEMNLCVARRQWVLPLRSLPPTRSSPCRRCVLAPTSLTALDQNAHSLLQRVGPLYRAWVRSTQPYLRLAIVMVLPWPGDPGVNGVTLRVNLSPGFLTFLCGGSRAAASSAKLPSPGGVNKADPRPPGGSMACGSPIGRRSNL